MSYVRQGQLLLYCTVLCGCVTYPDYPSSWASLEFARKDCFSVSGVYHNRGVGGRYGGAILTQKLFRENGWPVKNTEQAHFVEIAVTKEGTLDLTAIYWSSGSSLPMLKKQFFANKEEYRCNDGKIEIPQFVIDFSGARQASVILLKSNDGALVVKDGAHGLMVFVVPISGFEWSRFMPSH